MAILYPLYPCRSAYETSAFVSAIVLALAAPSFAAEDIVVGVSSSCDLEGALDAVRDGAAWAGTNATTEILEMIDNAICEFYDNN